MPRQKGEGGGEGLLGEGRRAGGGAAQGEQQEEQQQQEGGGREGPTGEMVPGTGQRGRQQRGPQGGQGGGPVELQIAGAGPDRQQRGGEGGDGVEEQGGAEPGGFGEKKRGAADRLGQNRGGGAAPEFAREGFARRHGGQDQPADEIERHGAVADDARGIAECVVEQQRQQEDAADAGERHQQEDGTANGFQRGEAGNGAKWNSPGHRRVRRGSDRRGCCGP
jgi:hypothetical protein